MKKQNLKELVRQALTNEQDVEARADKIGGQETLSKASNLLDSLELALKNHDWYYEMSDDPRIYDKGQSQMSNIKSIMKQLNSMGYGDDANSLFNQYKQQKPHISEDLDLGHEDNEPHHIKSELYKIGKYAMELYQIMDELEGQGEIDLPAWWQSKITKACSMIGSAKHYLEFELKEPEIDAMVDVAQDEDVLSEVEVGDQVTIKKSYGGGKGKVTDKKGSFVIVNGKSYHESDVTIVKETVTGPDKDFVVSIINKLKTQGKLDPDAEKTLYSYMNHPSGHREGVLAILKVIDNNNSSLDEKTLTKAEKDKKEDIVKGMKKTFKGPKPVMYAIATDKAKKLAETIAKRLKNND